MPSKIAASLRREGDERYAGAQAGAELVVTSVERDSTGKAVIARGTIGGEGDFTVPMLGREATEGDHFWVRYPKGRPATGTVEYVAHLASDQAGAGIIATNPNLPAPTFADPWFATMLEGSPGHIVARFTVLFNAVEAKYRPSGYTVSYRVSGGTWADVPVPHTGGVQSCRLPMGFAPGATIDVKLRARYNWNASESIESETRSQEVALDSASPGAATGLQVDTTSPGALVLTATGAPDPAFFATWEYTVATAPTGDGAVNFRSPGQVTFAGPPDDYYVRVVPISKSGVSGSPFPASGYAGPYTIPEYKALDTTPPDAFAQPPTLAARTVQLADGSARAFLKVTLPAAYVFPPDYARTVVRLLETASGNYQFWTVDGTATEIEQAVGFGTWQVDAVGEDVAGNRQAAFGPEAAVVIAAPGLPANPADPVCAGTGLAIKVSYALPAGALRVEIERSTDNLGAGAVSLGTFGGTFHLDLLATDQNTVVLPSYWYRIRGVNAAGVGAWSNRVQGTVLALHGSYLAADSVTAREIAADTITANEIAAGAVDTAELAAGAVKADKVDIATNFGRNYFANPSFELDADGDGIPDGWTIAGVNRTVTIQGLDGLAKHGSRSFRHAFSRTLGAGNNGYTDIQQYITAAPGQTWTISAWVKGVSYVPGGQDGFRVVLAFFNGGTLISETDSPLVQTTSWQRLTATATAPAGTTRIYAALRQWSDPNRAAGGTTVDARWDAAQIELAGAASDFDPRNVNGQGWTVTPQAIVGRDSGGVLQTYLDTDGTIRSGSRNVLLNKDGVTVLGSANQTDVSLKRDASGRGIVQAGGSIFGPNGITLAVDPTALKISYGANDPWYLRGILNPPDFGATGNALGFVGEQGGATDWPFFFGWTSGDPATWNGLNSWVYMHRGLLAVSGSIEIAVPNYSLSPLDVHQAAALAGAVGSTQNLQSWQLITGSANWLTARLAAQRFGNASDWHYSVVTLQPDIDNFGARGGWLGVGWAGLTAYWGLGTGTPGAWGELYRGAEGTIHCTLPFSKASGTFEIPHPDPAKAETHNLRHSFVESPTRGDNLYRYRVTLPESLIGRHDLDLPLPDWFRHLNVLEGDARDGDLGPQVWVNPVGHFGRAWGEVYPDGGAVYIRADEPGDYEVLVIATRGDPAARRGWDDTGRIEPPLRAEQRQAREEARK